MSALVGDCPPRSRPTTCRRRVGSTCRAFPPLYSVASVCVCGVPSCAAGAPYLRCSRIPHSYNKTARRAAGRGVERATGIEPASEAWEASILPMNYARNSSSRRNRPVDHIVTLDGRATGVGWACVGILGRGCGDGSCWRWAAAWPGILSPHHRHALLARYTEVV